MLVKFEVLSDDPGIKFHGVHGSFLTAGQINEKKKALSQGDPLAIKGRV